MKLVYWTLTKPVALKAQYRLSQHHLSLRSSAKQLLIRQNFGNEQRSEIL